MINYYRLIGPILIIIEDIIILISKKFVHRFAFLMVSLVSLERFRKKESLEK